MIIKPSHFVLHSLNIFGDKYLIKIVNVKQITEENSLTLKNVKYII